MRCNVYMFVNLLSVVFFQLVYCENLPECDSWAALEQDLHIKDHSVVCNKFNNCSGMKCSGTINGDEFHASIEVECETPISIILTADMPELGINAWRRKFTQGESFNLTDFIQCEFFLDRKNNNLTIGLDVELMVSKSKFLQFLGSASKPINVFRGVTIPSCSNSKNEIHRQPQNIISSTMSTFVSLPIPGLLGQEGNCSINNSTCGQLEICKQIDEHKFTGVCVCIADYIRDYLGKCVYSPSVETSSVSSNYTEPSTKIKPSNTSVLLTAILVPITVIVIIVIAVYGTIKFRIFQYLRRRLHVRVYEHVQLGQDDDNDDQMENPVA